MFCKIYLCLSVRPSPHLLLPSVSLYLTFLPSSCLCALLAPALRPRERASPVAHRPPSFPLRRLQQAHWETGKRNEKKSGQAICEGGGGIFLRIQQIRVAGRLQPEQKKQQPAAEHGRRKHRVCRPISAHGTRFHHIANLQRLTVVQGLAAWCRRSRGRDKSSEGFKRRGGR